MILIKKSGVDSQWMAVRTRIYLRSVQEVSFPGRRVTEARNFCATCQLFR
jgi:hypothetical protein